MGGTNTKRNTGTEVMTARAERNSMTNSRTDQLCYGITLLVNTVCILSHYITAEWFENKNIKDIVTPVKVSELRKILRECNYHRVNPSNFQFLMDGFTNGFKLDFWGNRKVKQRAANLKFTVGDKWQLWSKVMKEVRLKRYAGPFENPSYEYFIQSPIGLVPKDGGRNTRLIFHLSYPRTGKLSSINAGIPKQSCTVKYPDFEEAIKLCQSAGKSAKAAKSDMASAFRHLPMAIGDFSLLLMMAKHPGTGKIYYFIDKCLPFGSSISCCIFQNFSDAIAFIITHKSGKPNINYLDDFLFVAFIKQQCVEQVELFTSVCKTINFPVALNKTTWGHHHSVPRPFD